MVETCFSAVLIGTSKAAAVLHFGEHANFNIAAELTTVCWLMQQNTITEAQRRATALGSRQTAQDEEAGRILLGTQYCLNRMSLLTEGGL